MLKKLSVLVLITILTGCSPKQDDKIIRIASHTEPMTTVVNIAKDILAEEGYTLELVNVSDNTAANLALSTKEIDANFFQHQPYMKQFNQANNANLAGIQTIYDALVGFYSKHYESLDQLPKDATIAIPNDQVNQARALLILESYGYISLKENKTHDATIKDVENSPYTFVEVDLLTLTHAYDEVDVVFNYPTYIKAINLKPLKDAILLEKESDNHYAISLVAREDNKDSLKIKKLKEAMTHEKVKDFLTNEENSQTLRPSF